MLPFYLIDRSVEAFLFQTLIFLIWAKSFGQASVAAARLLRDPLFCLIFPTTYTFHLYFTFHFTLFFTFTFCFCLQRMVVGTTYNFNFWPNSFPAHLLYSCLYFSTFLLYSFLAQLPLPTSSDCGNPATPFYPKTNTKLLSANILQHSDFLPIGFHYWMTSIFECELFHSNICNIFWSCTVQTIPLELCGFDLVFVNTCMEYTPSCFSFNFWQSSTSHVDHIFERLV